MPVAPTEQAQAATHSIANLIAPHAFEVARIADVKAEIFGPVLQVVRSQILYFRDVTHETEVDRMKSVFLSHAAHELRTPMVSIYGYAERGIVTKGRHCEGVRRRGFTLEDRHTPGVALRFSYCIRLAT